MSRVLVISPHPDDEVIGCGGTLRKHVLEGDAVHTVFLTSGEQGGHGLPAEQTLRLREQEARRAAEIMGLGKPEFWRQPDGQLRASQQIVNQLRTLIKNWMPDIIYVTHSGEMHPDHRAAARIVKRAVAGCHTLATVPVIRMCEVWTPLQDMDEIVDISPYIEVKVAAIRAHKSQCDVVRFHEATLALNRYRGELHSWPGGDYAEIFLEMRL